jgi:hypothetical protein
MLYYDNDPRRQLAREHTEELANEMRRARRLTPDEVGYPGWARLGAALVRRTERLRRGKGYHAPPMTARGGRGTAARLELRSAISGRAARAQCRSFTVGASFRLSYELEVSAPRERLKGGSIELWRCVARQPSGLDSNRKTDSARPSRMKPPFVT